MNKIPSQARSARKLESDLMNAVYMIHSKLLYRYMKNLTGIQILYSVYLFQKINVLLEQFHSSILDGHMSMFKCVLILQQKLYCPNLAYHVGMYIISCHVCQTFKNHKRLGRPYNGKIINVNTPALTHI